MPLIQLFPELSGKTLWAHMPDWAATLVWREIALEQEFGPMPNNSFYKSLAIKICRKAINNFRGAK